VIILDGMDQFKTRCPRYAGKVKYEGTTLQQKLIGVLVHGRGFYTYRAFANTQHGTNLMIDCLMRTLVRLPSPLPRNLFLQVDGGPENRSTALYSFLTYLVGAGFFDEASYHLRTKQRAFLSMLAGADVLARLIILCCPRQDVS